MRTLQDGTSRTLECPGCFSLLCSGQGADSLAPLFCYPHIHTTSRNGVATKATPLTLFSNEHCPFGPVRFLSSQGFCKFPKQVVDGIGPLIRCTIGRAYRRRIRWELCHTGSIGRCRNPKHCLIGDLHLYWRLGD